MHAMWPLGLQCICVCKPPPPADMRKVATATVLHTTQHYKYQRHVCKWMHCTASDATVRRIYQVVMCHHIVQGSTYKGQYTFAMLGPSSARRVVAFTKRNLNTNHARNWPYPGSSSTKHSACNLAHSHCQHSPATSKQTKWHVCQPKHDAV